MSRRKIELCETIKASIKIVVLVEGQTEKNYLKELKNKFLDNNFRLEIEDMHGGNYASFLSKIVELRGTETPILIVVDLDRAANDIVELRRLKELINKLVKINKQNNIFLTYPNFETFLSAHFNPYCDNLALRLGFRDGDDIKTKTDVLVRIESHGGCFKNTERYFDESSLFYNKSDFLDAQINEYNIDRRQSSLVNFIKYCNKIKQSR